MNKVSYNYNENWINIDKETWLKNRSLFTKRNNDSVCIVSYDNRTTDDLMRIKNINSKYCSLNNYTFLFFDLKSSGYLEEDYPPYWLKVKLIYDVMMSDRHDYVCWIDSDAMFVDKDIRIENLFPDDTFMVISSDIGDPGFNAGVFFIKNCKLGKDFLKEWIDAYDSDIKKYWKKNGNKWVCKKNEEICPWSNKEYEQGFGVIILHKNKYNNFIAFYDMDILQALYKKDFSFVNHLYGTYGKKIIKDNVNSIEKYYGI